jgi:hypothetical protein
MSLPAPKKAPRGSCAGALVGTVLLSALLCWLPLLGPFLAGFVGGRRARHPVLALLVAILAGALWVAALMWASHQTLHLKGQQIGLDFMRLLVAPPTVAFLIAGALVGSTGRSARVVGLVILAVAVGWLVGRATAIIALYRTLQPAAVSNPAGPKETSQACPENLKQLYNAALLYSDSWDGVLPPADRWATLIKPNVPNDKWLHCPSMQDPRTQYGYAMNPELGGKRLNSIMDRSRQPLFYDTTDTAMDAHLPPSSMPKPGRHAGQDSVVYLDGHVEAVTPR